MDSINRLLPGLSSFTPTACSPSLHGLRILLYPLILYAAWTRAVMSAATAAAAANGRSDPDNSPIRGFFTAGVCARSLPRRPRPVFLTCPPPRLASLSSGVSIFAAWFWVQRTSLAFRSDLLSVRSRSFPPPAFDWPSAGLSHGRLSFPFVVLDKKMSIYQPRLSCVVFSYCSSDTYLRHRHRQQ